MDMVSSQNSPFHTLPESMAGGYPQCQRHTNILAENLVFNILDKKNKNKKKIKIDGGLGFVDNTPSTK